MIQISTGTAEYLGYRLLVDAVRSLAESENVPTCLHLDHCSDISAIETAMNAGFSSVMYDGSHLGLEENIGNTRIVVEMARPRNITVEGELGAIGVQKMVKPLPQRISVLPPSKTPRAL